MTNTFFPIFTYHFSAVWLRFLQNLFVIKGEKNLWFLLLLAGDHVATGFGMQAGALELYGALRPGGQRI